jgi:hypothetical protein
VRANGHKSSQEDYEEFLTRFNGFYLVSPDFESRAGEHRSQSDRLPRPALKVRANGHKSSEEDYEEFLTRFNGFYPVSPDFESRAGEHRSHRLSRFLSIN